MLKIQLLGFILVSIGLTFVCLGLIFSQTRYYQIASYDRHSDYDGFGFEISHTFHDENEDLGNEIYYNPLKYDYLMAEMVLNATADIAKICEDWKHNKYERDCDLSRSCDVQNIFSSILAKYFNVSHSGEYFRKNSYVFEKMLDIYKKYFNAKGSCFYPKKEFITYGILQTVFINPKSMFLTHEKVLPKIVGKFDEFITKTVKCEIADKMTPELGFDLYRIQNSLFMRRVKTPSVRKDIRQLMPKRKYEHLIHQQIYMAEVHRFFDLEISSRGPISGFYSRHFWNFWKFCYFRKICLYFVLFSHCNVI